MAIQLRRGTNAQWEALKSNIVVGELATTYDSERAFLGTGEGTYFEMANIELIADEFDSSVSYAEGDVCIYQGKLYQFTADHSGAWSGTDVEQVTASEVGSGGTAISDLQDNALIHRTASGSIASFSDGSTMPMDSLIADINPVQNLNGYDYPWSGGGGKNKANISTLNIPANTDTTVQLSESMTLEAGTYTLSWTLGATVTATRNRPLYYINGSRTYADADSKTAGRASWTFTLAEDSSVQFWWWYHTVSTATTATNFMLESGSTATTYEPYSNICPISGWDSVDVNVTGINVWDEEWENGYYNRTTGAKAGDSNTAYFRSKNFIPCVPNTQYFVKLPSVHASNTTYFAILYYDKNKNYISNIQPSSYNTPLFTTQSNTYYMTFYCEVGTTGATYQHDISINYPSTDTEYHAYNGNTTTVALGQTVYGGTLNVTTGVLTIDMGYVDLGTLTWSYADTLKMFVATLNGMKYVVASNVPDGFICSQYRGVSWSQGTASTTYDSIFCVLPEYNQFRVRDTQYTDATAFTTAMSGVYLCYELASQTTVQLSPTQVASLLGQNNVFASSGDVEVTYKANASLTIEEIINAITSLGGNV